MSTVLDDLQIVELSSRPDLLNRAVDYFWNCWGSESNHNFYKDCMHHSLNSEVALPKFYIAIIEGKIVGTYALLINDLISRQDLFPWFGCLFVDEPYRGRGIAGTLLNHGLGEAASKGFETLYLSTDLSGFYEKNGWAFLTIGYGVSGGEDKIYFKRTTTNG